MAMAFIAKQKISEAELCPRALKSFHLVGLDFFHRQKGGLMGGFSVY